MDWAPVSQRIWDMKYRFRDPAGAKDEDLQATWKRVARALAMRVAWSMGAMLYRSTTRTAMPDALS